MGDAEKKVIISKRLSDKLHQISFSGSAPHVGNGPQNLFGSFPFLCVCFCCLLALSMPMGVLAITECETGTALPYLPGFPMSLNAFYFEIPGGAWQR